MFSVDSLQHKRQQLITNDFKYFITGFISIILKTLHKRFEKRKHGLFSEC